MRKFGMIALILAIAVCLAVPAWAGMPGPGDPDYILALANIKMKNAKVKGAKATATMRAAEALMAKEGAKTKKYGDLEAKYFGQRPAKQAASKAAAKREDNFYRVLGWVPFIGDIPRSYSSGQMRTAEYNIRYLRVTGKSGPKSADRVAVADALLKPASNWPEGAVAATLFTPFRKNWRDQDPYSGLNAERSHLADGGVIVAKGLSMALPGAYAPVMGVNPLVAGPIENAFVWGAVVGIPANVAASYVEK
ncbi:MAG: hypothetical protein PHF35_04370 [Candidatus Moranbacteria bacterium]|nr:hypothetical protein [Candidatus Moranbacteria bacterium]